MSLAVAPTRRALPDRLGAQVLSTLEAYLAIWFLGYAALKGLVLERGRGLRLVARTTATQVYFTAVQPLPIFLATGVLFGVVVIVAADQILPRYGLQSYIPALVSVALVREVGPLLIAMILIGRTGTAIATELGYMRLGHEIEALDAAGINVDYYLVLPRLLGVTAASVLLVVLFAASGIVGGFLVAQVLRLVGVTLLLPELVGAIDFHAIFSALVKATIFGATIALSNCYHGLRVSGSFTSIPRANAVGVVQSLLVCFVVNAGVSVYVIL